MKKIKSGYKWILAMALIVLTGCANTYTNRNPILTVQVTIQLREPLSPLVRYYIITGVSNSILFPSLESLMATPGRYVNDDHIGLNSGGFLSYYSYLNTWRDYMVIDPDISVYQSGGAFFVAPREPNNPSLISTPNFLSSPLPSQFRPTITLSGSTIIVRWKAQDLTGNLSRFWVQVATTTTETGIGIGYLKDYLSKQQEVLVQQGHTTSQYEGESPFLPGAFDIVKCDIEVR